MTLICKCGLEFGSLYHRRQHALNCETNEYQCTCGNRFLTQKGLGLHKHKCDPDMLKIENEKSFVDEIENIESKQELYTFACKYLAKLNHCNGNTLADKIKKFCKNRLKIYLESMPDRDLYCYLSGNEIRKCEICNAECKMISFRGHFFQFCSRKCHLKWRSQRQSENNTVHRIRDRKTWSNNISKRLKLAIAEGRFTPDVTNSWCNSRRIVEINGRTVCVRSSWEEKFLLMNPTFEYEKTRIPYIDKYGQQRTYIVDFTDSEGNLYEIKPSSKIGENSEKILAAREFCKQRNVQFNLITENELQ